MECGGKTPLWMLDIVLWLDESSIQSGAVSPHSTR